MSISFCGKTDVGRRRELNEDTFYASDDCRFAVVADGMGGRDFGEVASSLFVSSFKANVKKYMPDSYRDRTRDDGSGAAHHLITLFDGWIRDVNEAVSTWGGSDGKYQEMGTTVAILYQQTDFAVVGHVGDSRVYRFRDGALELLTEDHSFINTQLKARLITPEEALTSNHRNIITRAIGTRFCVKPTLSARSARPGDVFLLCSDGLSDLVPDPRIEELMALYREDQEAAVDALVDEANNAGGKDNITVVLGRVSEDGAAEADAPVEDEAEAGNEAEVEGDS
ncbi:MAG: protein phosphatase 2C domain-containing protein [Planctomycetota bacterium]